MNSNEILMPALSPTMEEGGIAKWLVKEGDIIKAGDLIAEIETDKAIMEFESALDCKISKVLTIGSIFDDIFSTVSYLFSLIKFDM